MSDMECLSVEERNTIEELKHRVKNKLTSPALKEDSSLLYRFLKARDFDVDKAEKMLTKHIDWRKVYQVDTIVETFKPKEVFLKYIEPSLVGFSKKGFLVRYAGTGRLNNAELLKCITIHDYMKHWIWFTEKNISLAVKQGKTACFCFILDLDGLEFTNATSKSSADIFLCIIQLLQDNYPERLKSVYIINAPSFYVFVYTIVKAVMSKAMIKKIHIFSNSGWKEKLLEDIDADILPAFLGGKRTDPDGDPYCRSVINFSGKIPESYYLSQEDRYFKNPTEVTTIMIHPLGKKELFVQVEDAGTLIICKFMVRSKSIGVGLFFQETEALIKEIIPMHEYDTSDGIEENFYRCFSKGKYIIMFENPSRFSKKEIQYIISVLKPEI